MEKKNYIIPESNVSEKRLRVNILAGSNVGFGEPAVPDAKERVAVPVEGGSFD